MPEVKYEVEVSVEVWCGTCGAEGKNAERRAQSKNSGGPKKQAGTQTNRRN